MTDWSADRPLVALTDTDPDTKPPACRPAIAARTVAEVWHPATTDADLIEEETTAPAPVPAPVYLRAHCVRARAVIVAAAIVGGSIMLSSWIFR